VRARSTGGAFAPFDAFSPLTDAVLADVRRMSASVTSGASWRSVDAGGVQSSLRGTRFPAMVITGPVTRRIVVAGGFTTYLDRSFGVVIQDTIDLRGVQQPITDQIISDGAVSDLRFAVAARLHNRLALGLGLHRLTGSTRVVATRTFADSLYRTTTARDEVAYGGVGGSASLLFDLTSDVRVAGWFRTDSKLRADVGGITVAENDLPRMYGAGVQWRAGAQASVAGTVSWRNWGAVQAVPMRTTRSTGHSARKSDRQDRRSAWARAAESCRSAWARHRPRSDTRRASAGNSPAAAAASTSVSSGCSARAWDSASASGRF